MTSYNNDAAQSDTTQSLSHARHGEGGSVMVVALMCLVVLFALTIAATKIRVASARDIEDKTAQATEYWNARSGASTVEASLTTDIPSIFDAEMLRAQTAVGGYPLPAFDPPQISANYSRPVLNADGAITNSNASDCTSLLGNLNAWAQRKTSIAETYAAERGYGPDKARVAVFQEALRQQLIGADPNSEPAYLLEYQIDAAVGQQGNARGRVRPSGKIMLGPAQQGCNTTVSLTAAPTDIALGSSSTLTITYTNASRVWLTDQTGAPVPGTDTNGLTETPDPQTLTFNVSPIDNTSYRAHADGSGCRAVSGEVTIIINYPPPEIIQFNPTPACINRGQSATLTFQVRYASSITITGAGVNQTFPGNTGTTVTSGTLVVSPTSDTTYTLTATGRGGTAIRNTSVTVKQSFSIDQFTSNTSCVIPGNPVDLTWANTNAETATITDSTTGASVNVTPSGGTRSFTVNSTTTYTLSITRTGCSGVETLTRQLTVNTSPGPTATFAANPSEMELGNTTTLQWTTTNASTVTITPSPVAGSGMSGPQTVSSSGSLTITPSAINQSPGYTYTLTVTSGGCSPQTITKTTLVIVRPVFVPPPCPGVISFTADSCVASGGNSTLQWNVADSDSITITGPGINQTFSGNPVGTGSLIVNPTADATYTLTAKRAGSCTAASPPLPTSASVTVRISQTPAVNDFTATPSVIDAGQASRLTWSESSNLSSVRITGSGGDTNTYTVPPGQRFLDVRPPATSTYTITVTNNDCAGQTSNRTATVTVASCPTVNSFTASPTNIINGASSTLQWSTSNATQVLLNGTPVATNGTAVVSPNTTTTYRLTAISSNGTCNVDRFVTITVAACSAPQILSFTATPGTVLIGGNQMVRLAWSINDTSGTGVTVNINPAVGNFITTNGFVDISQPQSTTTYTLTVTNGCGTTSIAQATVNASPCSTPTITTFTASPNAVTIGGNQTVRLSWVVDDSTSTGLSTTIAGIGTWATSSAFIDIPQPQSTTTYTLTTTNGCGAVSTAQVIVTATSCEAPIINSFTATPNLVSIGGNQTVRLSWAITDTSGTGVSVSIPSVGTFMTAAGFVDITQPQTITTYTLTATAGCGAQSTAQTVVNIQSTPCPPASPGGAEATGGGGGGGRFSLPGVNTEVRIIYFANYYPDRTLKFNLRLEISNRSDGSGLSGHGLIGVVAPPYVGFLGNLKYNFYPGNYHGTGVGLLGIQFYDSNDTLVATIPFNQIVNQGNMNIYTLSGDQASFFTDPGAVIPYSNFDFLNDKIGINPFSVNAGNIHFSVADSSTFNTSVTGSTDSFHCVN
jgi:hypothetical protein